MGGEAEGPGALLPGSLAELGGALWSSGCLRMQKGRLTWRPQGHAGWRGALLLWTDGAGGRQGCGGQSLPCSVGLTAQVRYILQCTINEL